MWRSGGVDRAWASPSVIEVPAGALAGVASTSIASTIPLARLSLARRKRGVGGAREAESWPTPARGDTWKYDLYKACVTDHWSGARLHFVRTPTGYVVTRTAGSPSHRQDRIWATDQIVGARSILQPSQGVALSSNLNAQAIDCESKGQWHPEGLARRLRAQV